MSTNERGHLLVETVENIIKRGKLNEFRSVSKFGRNPAVGTSYEDIWTVGGIYDWNTSAETIGILSDGAGDSVAGSGARQVRLSGIDENFDYIDELINLSGTTTVNSINQYLRVNRVRVVRQGTYGRTNVSNADIIYASGVSTGLIHAQILVDPTALGQTQVARYSIAKNHYAILKDIKFSIEATLTADMILFIREDAMKVSAPFGGVNMKGIWDAVDGSVVIPLDEPMFINAKSGADIWFASKASAPAKVDVTFDLQVYPITMPSVAFNSY
jgi:hypothetical protein